MVLAITPAWLRALAKANPLSYQADALRTLMLAHAHPTFSLTTDFVVLIGVLIALLGIAARLYPRVRLASMCYLHYAVNAASLNAVRPGVEAPKSRISAAPAAPRPGDTSGR